MMIAVIRIIISHRKVKQYFPNVNTLNVNNQQNMREFMQKCILRCLNYYNAGFKQLIM